MFRREFLEAAGATGAAVSLAGEEKATRETATTTGELSISIDDGALYLCGYPLDDEDMETGDVFLTTGQGDVHLGISASDGDRLAEASFSFDPETAEDVGDMLHEFAAKARDDEGWVYP